MLITVVASDVQFFVFNFLTKWKKKKELASCSQRRRVMIGQNLYEMTIPAGSTWWHRNFHDKIWDEERKNGGFFFVLLRTNMEKKPIRPHFKWGSVKVKKFNVWNLLFDNRWEWKFFEFSRNFPSQLLRYLWFKKLRETKKRHQMAFKKNGNIILLLSQKVRVNLKVERHNGSKGKIISHGNLLHPWDGTPRKKERKKWKIYKNNQPMENFVCCVGFCTPKLIFWTQQKASFAPNMISKESAHKKSYNIEGCEIVKHIRNRIEKAIKALKSMKHGKIFKKLKELKMKAHKNQIINGWQSCKLHFCMVDFFQQNFCLLAK